MWELAEEDESDDCVMIGFISGGATGSTDVCSPVKGPVQPASPMTLSSTTSDGTPSPCPVGGNFPGWILTNKLQCLFFFEFYFYVFNFASL